MHLVIWREIYENRYFRVLQNEIYLRCKKPTNKFGMGCYHHIKAVVKNGEVLAEKYNADKEIVMIAAWLHDMGKSK